jgi:two-component system OmpR family response regulator
LNVLEILVLSAGRVVRKDRLCEQISGHGELVSDNAIEVYMHRLRKHLKSGGINIRTLRGLGYMLEKQ